MTARQFENYINALLTLYGYNSINPRQRVEGRGTTHQIDAIGISNMTPVFSYPITIIAEAKYYDSRRSLGIEILRNFYGVIDDIKQKLPRTFTQPQVNINSYINGTSNIIGVVITTAGFSSFSRNFGYAHGIFMMTIGFVKKKCTLYFGSIGGQTVIIQIPDHVALNYDKSDRRHIEIAKIVGDEKVYITETNSLTGKLKLKKELTYQNEKMKGVEKNDEYPQIVTSYLYDIEILELKTTFRTITQDEISNDTELIIQLPKSKTYLNVEIKSYR
jgi:hypothetical protein